MEANISKTLYVHVFVFQMIMHQYALHRISYCADDKSDKKMFTFIAKAGETNQHFCYVFDSEKCVSNQNTIHVV